MAGNFARREAAGPARSVAALLVPFLLSASIVLADQLSKFLIVTLIPDNTVGASLLGGIVRIDNVRNPGIAFSIGQGAPEIVRSLAFTVVPLLVLASLVWFSIRGDGISGLQRWAVAGILGGGLGNIIDRIFRPRGVVDFIDIKFYGIFGLDRWPTFNIADASVVVCGTLLVISLFLRNRNGANE